MYAGGVHLLFRVVGSGAVVDVIFLAAIVTLVGGLDRRISIPDAISFSYANRAEVDI